MKLRQANVFRGVVCPRGSGGGPTLGRVKETIHIISLGPISKKRAPKSIH